MESLLCNESIPNVIDISNLNKSIDVEPTVDRILVNDKRVMENMLLMESHYSIVDYCGHVQSEIAPHMRKIVTDWMMEVCEDQHCQPEVFFLAVNYLDRFLSLVNIKKNQFQLLASVCILLASKFSQVVPITTEQLVIYTDNSVTIEQLRLWEMEVLNVLQWEISASTAHSFLTHFCSSRGIKNEESVSRQAASLAAMASTEYKFITTKQSIIAAASLAAAVQLEEKNQAATKNVIEYLSVLVKSSPKEIMFFMHHLADFSSEDSDSESGYSSDSSNCSDVKVSQKKSSFTNASNYGFVAAQ